MLAFNLQEVFRARHIERPYSFLVKQGISPATASKILNNGTYVMRLKHITIICEALHCSPNDILIYKPNTDKPIAENHPLNKLRPQQFPDDLKLALKTLPLEKLREIGKLIKETPQTP